MKNIIYHVLSRLSYSLGFVHGVVDGLVMRIKKGMAR